MASFVHCRPATSAAASTSFSYLHPMLSCREETEADNDNRVSSRVELMKQRYAGLIEKAQKTLSGQTTIKDGEKLGKNRSLPTISRKSDDHAVLGHPTNREKKFQVVADNVGMRMMEEKKEIRKMESIQKQREAARRELEQMRDTAGFNDSMEALRDFEKLIGCRGVTGGYTYWPIIPVTFELSKNKAAQCLLDKHKYSHNNGASSSSCSPASVLLPSADCRGHELSSDKRQDSRAEQLKMRFAGIVDKAGQTTSLQNIAGDRKRKRSDQMEQHHEISETKKSRRKVEMLKRREVARMGMEQVRKTYGEELEEGEIRE